MSFKFSMNRAKEIFTSRVLAMGHRHLTNSCVQRCQFESSLVQSAQYRTRRSNRRIKVLRSCPRNHIGEAIGCKHDIRTFASKGQSAQTHIENQELFKFNALLSGIRDGEEKHRTLDEWLSGEHSGVVSCLLDYVVDPLASNHRAIHSLLVMLGAERSVESALRILVDIGCWAPHLVLSLAKLDVQTFSPEVEKAVEQLLSNPPEDLDKERRIDLTHLKTMTIDDASTTEIDDGLSYEVLPCGSGRIWIHIADPTRWLDIDDDIVKEAERRATSLYLPTGLIPMVPHQIASGIFSLVKDNVCFALSLGVTLNTDTGEVKDYTIVPSYVKPTYRLTYEETNELLAFSNKECEAELFSLMQAAKLRKSFRIKNGAVGITSAQCKIKVSKFDSNHTEVTVERQENGFSDLATELVTEMMVLAGEVGARWGCDNNIPLPYRGQYKPVLPDERDLEEIPHTMAKDAAVRKTMTRAILSCHSPYPHAGLGLPMYSQLSSPIRRFNDMLAHFQIKAVLRGDQPLFNADELQNIAEGAHMTQRESTKVVRDEESYWFALFLLQNEDKIWEGTLMNYINVEHGIATVLFEELGMEKVCRILSPASAGASLSVKAVNVEARLDGNSIFHFEAWSASQNQPKL